MQFLDFLKGLAYSQFWWLYKGNSLTFKSVLVNKQTRLLYWIIAIKHAKKNYIYLTSNAERPLYQIFNNLCVFIELEKFVTMS